MTASQIFALLQIVLQMMDNLTTNAAVQSVIDIIEEFLPDIQKAEETTVEAFKKVIADLKGSVNLTPAQLQSLLEAKAALDARVDKAIDVTLGTEDPQPGTGS